MAAKSRKLSPHILLLINILLYLNTNLARASSANAVDTISKGEFLTGNQTISSKNGRFELGFFTPGSSGNYYIGIWYKSLPNQTVVWVANREVPVQNPSASKLLLTETGNLILSTTSNNNINIPVWSTNSTTTSRTAAAVLLNTGNLKLFVNGSDQNSTHVWQSFDDPTDTALPGSWTEFNKITGEYKGLTSWKNSENPSRGLFSEDMDRDGSNQLVIYRNLTKIIWASGVWNGAYFENLPSAGQKNILNFIFIDGKDRKYYTYTANDGIITRTVMGTNGQLVQYLWIEDSQQWQSVSATPILNCDVYELCGAFGVCEEKSTSVCQCLFGFEPTSDRDWKLNDWSNGCKRKSQLQCGNDWFFEMGNMRLPDNPIQNFKTSRLDCEASCRNDCSCNAYAYAYDDNNGSCKVWKGELQNTQLYDGDTGGATLFLRLSARDMPPSSVNSKSSHPNHNHIAMILGLVLSSVILITYVVIVLARVYQRRRRARLFKKVDGSLIRFHYRELRRMTKNFTQKLGSGGFGTVYKGEMPNSIPVAIKLLQGLRQGEKQFRAEVSTLGAIQHVNLVRLRGFCFEGSSTRLLVYELMPKGSLDAHLFKGTPVLNWSTRYKIALGTAKGLAYLHEECRERIIHCDIKPDNILLDESFVPKVADFGLAKLYDRDFSKVLTSMRGTVGYLAPEWISGSKITSKVDVYSYGMMLFEIISGKRNGKNDDVEGKDYYHYPLWAARQIIKGDAMSILDSRLNGDASLEEVSRVGKLAIWCVQDMEEHRPTMSQIVQILEGVLKVSMPPIPHVLQIHQKQEVEN